MDNLQISGTTAAATVGWILGFALIVAGVVTGSEIGGVGLYLTGAAMVLHVKRYFGRLQHRERAAYELGQESVRSIH